MKPRNSITAIILAGGKGSRFGPLGRMMPKILFRIGDKSILDRLVDHCKKAGADEIIISVSKSFAPLILAAIPGIGNGISVRCLIEEVPLGTGWALVSFIEAVKNNACLLILGDEFYENDSHFSKFGDTLKYAEGRCMTLGIIRQSRADKIEKGCNIVLDELGKVARIIDKPLPQQITGDIRWACVVGFGPGTLKVLRQAKKQKNSLQYIGDALEFIRKEGIETSVLDVPGIEININSLRELILANKVVNKKTSPRISTTAKNI